MTVLEDLIFEVREASRVFPDSRQADSRKTYSMLDAGMSAFSLFFMQCGSFLFFQREMEKTKKKSNCQTLFGMNAIPSDNHIRNMLDGVDPIYVHGVFRRVIERLDQAGGLKPFQVLGGRLLVALDGSECFCSTKISCPNCLQRKKSNGEIEYYHSFLNAAIVQPGNNNTILLPPEFIAPQDGQTKQDCEINAAKRWVHHHANFLKPYRPILLADDLFSQQPFVHYAHEQGFDFLTVCKASSHPTLNTLLGSTSKSMASFTKRKGKSTRTVFCEWINDVPLRKDDQGFRINWFSVVERDDHNKIIYSNSFMTNLLITNDNILELVDAGRSRWHIENGSFNVLKNNGYELARNYGHGQQFLAMLLTSLNLLAFTIHNVCDRVDEIWKKTRFVQHIANRKAFFEHLRSMSSMWCFPSWNDLLGVIFDPDSFELVVRSQL